MSMMKIIDFLICKVHMLSSVTEKCLFGLASLWHHQCWFHIIMCKIHTLYSIIYSTLYKVYGTQILYGHFDVLLFTYGVPLSCSNKDSSFQWKDAGVLVTSTSTTRYNIYIVFLPQLLSLSREPLLSDLLHMSEHIHKVCLEKKGDLCCNINMSCQYSIVWYTIL